MSRWWWPFHRGEGSGYWYPCEARLGRASCFHECRDERGHGYRHACRNCGFRWAA